MNSKNIMNIIFVCKRNSGRSQMAEAFFNSLSERAKAESAGTNPDEKIHPWTIQVMKEVGIDVSQKKPRPLTDKLMQKADKIIVMDSKLLENVPSEYLAKSENWQIEGLLRKPIEEVRKIRDEIKEKVENLTRELACQDQTQ